LSTCAAAHDVARSTWRRARLYETTVRADSKSLLSLSLPLPFPLSLPPRLLACLPAYFSCRFWSCLNEFHASTATITQGGQNPSSKVDYFDRSTFPSTPELRTKNHMQVNKHWRHEFEKRNDGKKNVMEEARHSPLL